MSIEIRVASSPGQAHVAVVEGNRLIDYALWRPGAPDGVGDVHRGRVTAPMPAMAGAFVALCNGEGFLPDSEGAKGLGVGSIVTVRVTRAAQGNKGPRLGAYPIPAEPGPPALLGRGPDPIARFAARYPGACVLVDDASLGFAPVTSSVFDEDVAEAIDALSRPVVALPGGATMSIRRRGRIAGRTRTGRRRINARRPNG